MFVPALLCANPPGAVRRAAQVPRGPVLPARVLRAAALRGMALVVPDGARVPARDPRGRGARRQRRLPREGDRRRRQGAQGGEEELDQACSRRDTDRGVPEGRQSGSSNSHSLEEIMSNITVNILVIPLCCESKVV